MTTPPAPPHPKIRLAISPLEKINPASKKMTREEEAGSDIPLSVERAFFLLRWLVIGLGLAIQLYVASSGAGGMSLIAHALLVTSLMAVFTGSFGVLRYYFKAHNSRSWLAGLEATAIAVVIGLDRGIYSPFQFLSYLIIADAALTFSSSNILTFAAFEGALYAAAVLLISGQKWTELTITIVLSQIVAMFIIASISGSMIKVIKQQRELARREKALSAQLNYQVSALSALNRLSEKLNASLDIEELMRSTMEALPAVLEVDACIGLLVEMSEVGRWEIGPVWHGISDGFIPLENLVDSGASDQIQVGPLIVSRSELDLVLSTGQPLRFPATVNADFLPIPESNNIPDQNLQTAEEEPAVLIVPLPADEGHCGILALLRQSGPAFGQSDQELLEALARQLSLLIKNARLYELERQNVARLQELEQMKSDFLSAVSHELRTPLTSIKASTILLLSQPPDDVSFNELKLYKNIDRNTERLNALVTDLLDLTKLQHGRLRLSFKPVDPVEVILDVVSVMRPLTDAKNQSLKAFTGELRPLIQADRRRVEQILTNLVSNAYRYTPRGSEIWIKLKEEESCLLFEVSDNGPGIDITEQPLIFNKFYRGHSQASKNGTGLGLSIASSLVELHGGRIWVESLPGVGSKFCFTLPALNETDLLAVLRPGQKQTYL